MKRREFLKSSLAASTLAGISLTGAEAKPTQEYYQLRVYRLNPDSDQGLLDRYLEKAAIPALNRIGCKPIGAFKEAAPKGDPAIYVLAPYPDLETFASVAARLRADAEYQSAGAEYLQT